MSAGVGVVAWCPPARRRWQPLQAHTTPESDPDAPDAGEHVDPQDPRRVVRPTDPQPIAVPPVPALRPLERRRAAR